MTGDPFAPTGDEGGRHPLDARLDAEAGRGEPGLQQRRAFRLLVSDLGQVPDLLGNGGVVGGVGLDVGRHGLVTGLGDGGSGSHEGG